MNSQRFRGACLCAVPVGWGQSDPSLSSCRVFLLVYSYLRPEYLPVEATFPGDLAFSSRGWQQVGGPMYLRSALLRAGRSGLEFSQFLPGRS